MKKIYTILAIIPILFIAGCIDKEVVQYPYEEGIVLTFEVEGQKSSTVNPYTRVISVELKEEYDPRKINIVKFELVENATTNLDITKPLDLTKDVEFTVNIYRDWDWKIVTTQPIERFVDIAGQFGAANIDTENKTVEVELLAKDGLWNVQVNEVKLAPKNATYNPIMKGIMDLSKPVEVEVTYWGDIVENWTLTAINSENSIFTGEPAHVWGGFAVVTGSVIEGATETPMFMYRKKGSGAEWASVPAIVKGGSITGILDNLEGGTTYVYKTALLGEEGVEKEFTTEGTPMIPNMGMEDWCQVETDGDEYWFPNSKPDEMNEFWCSGNKGGIMAGLTGDSSPTLPTTDTYDGKEGKAALLTSRAAGGLVGLIAPLIAGNLYTGYFLLEGLNATTAAKFSRPYSGRPTTLSFWYKYSPQLINIAKRKPELKGTMDQCHIHVYLGDWDKDYLLFTEFNKELTPGVIAYGEFFSDVEVSTYIKQTIELKYFRTDAIPTKIIISASSSRYGDYYTGGENSMLYLDAFEFGFGYTDALGLK